MTRFKQFICVLCALCGLQQVANAQVTEIKFDADANFLKPAAGTYFGEVTGLSLNNTTRHFYVYHRSSQRSTVHGGTAAQLWEFGPNGAFIREIGKDNYGFAFAHDVDVDKDGNIWTSDEGTNMIVKFSPDGKVLMALGRRDEAVEPVAEPRPGTRPTPRWGGFNRPTQVTWDLEGNIFVADGYNNSRVVKIDKNGKWVKTWGEFGKEPGQFNTVHTIASDAKGNIYVGDRGNNRIQVFDHDGNPLRIITIDVPYTKEPNVMLGAMPRPGANVLGANGAPWAICITPPNAQGTQYLYSADAVPGRLYKTTLEGKVLGVMGDAGKEVGQFGWVHQIACPSENELYVGEILNWRVQKLTLHPTAGQR